MYTDEQKRRHIYDLQVCLRRIQHENDHPQPLVPDGHLRRRDRRSGPCVSETERFSGLRAG